MSIGGGGASRQRNWRKVALAEAHNFVRATMRPQEAGVFSSSVPLLAVENTVGGTQLCMVLPRALQQKVVALITKHFNGASACLGCGTPDDQELRATALIFEPGSVQFVGAPGVSALHLLIHKLCDTLRANGHRPHILFVSIDNRVATGKIGFPIALERMYGSIDGFVTSYAPILFPGMICGSQRPGEKIVMTLFEGGKVTALGITSLKVASEVFLQMAMMARMYEVAPAVNTQKRKSEARDARLTTETAACRMDKDRSARKRSVAKLVVKEMHRLLEQHADRANDPTLWREIQQSIDKMIRDAAPQAGKRRRLEPTPDTLD